MKRPYDISVSLKLTAVRYLHTMRFLKEIIAFCQHFPQLLDAFQRMKAASRGDLVSHVSSLATHHVLPSQNYLGPVRKPRILVEADVGSPTLLIPKHAFSADIMGGVIGHFTVSNQFLFDGEEGTLSHVKPTSSAMSSSSSSSLNTSSCSVLSPGRSMAELSSTSLLWDRDTTEVTVEMDKERVKGVWSSIKGPCLLDCMELLLKDVDVFSARRVPLAGHAKLRRKEDYYKIVRDVSEEKEVWSAH